MRRIVIALLLTALTAFAVYVATLSYDFVWDDEFLIIENRYLEDWSELGNNLTSDFFRKTRDVAFIGYWRPVITLSYMLDRALFQDQAWGFHLRNVLLHVLSSCLVLLVAWRLPVSKRVALGAGLLFAAHPVHVESVAWVSGRTDVYCGLFALLAVFLDLEHARAPGRAKRFGSVVATCLALLSKEMAATLPGFIFLRAWFLPSAAERERGFPRSAIRTVLPHALVVVGYIVVRFGILGIETEEPWAFRAGRWVMFLTWWSGFLDYLRVLVWPSLLTVVLHVEQETSLLATRVLAGLTATALFVTVVWRTRRSEPGFAFALGIFLVSLVTLTNFIVPIGAPGSIPFPWSERFLYLPSAGFCIAASWLLLVGLPGWLDWRGKARNRGDRTPPVWAFALLALVTAALGVRAANRAADWENNLYLFRAAVGTTPESPLAHLSYGVALANLGRLGEAEEQYREALRLSPTGFRVRFDLGNVYRERGRLGEAETWYRESIRIQPKHAQSHLNLGLTLLESGRPDEALASFVRADEILPDYVDAKVNRANALRLLGRIDEAIPLYRAALELEPQTAPARLGLAGVYLQTGRTVEGMAILRRLLRDEPGMPEARLLLAIELDRNGRFVEAEEEYRKVLLLDPDNDRVRERLRRSAATPR
jgi:Flp pilus assembly protein TadD